MTLLTTVDAHVRLYIRLYDVTYNLNNYFMSSHTTLHAAIRLELGLYLRPYAFI